MATTVPHYFSLKSPTAPVACRRFVWNGEYTQYGVTEDDRLCKCGRPAHAHSLLARVGGD
jgi:hypothetical protein